MNLINKGGDEPDSHWLSCRGPRLPAGSSSSSGDQEAATVCCTGEVEAPLASPLAAPLAAPLAGERPQRPFHSRTGQTPIAPVAPARRKRREGEKEKHARRWESESEVK